MNLEEMRERAQQLQARENELLAMDQEADEEGLSDELVAELDDVSSRFKAMSERIARHERFEKANAGQTVAKTVSGSRISNPTPRSSQDPKRGYNNLGDFALDVMQASLPSGSVSRRLDDIKAQQGNETGVGADGGYLVPPDFRETIMQKIMGDQSVLSRTDGYQTGSNTVTVPIDETPPWETNPANGIVAYWTGEGATLTKSKAQFDQTTVPLHKLTALIPVTEEMTSDGPLIDGYLRSKTPEVFISKINDAILHGTGTGQPTGVVGHGFTVETATTTTAAAVVEYDDIVAMWARLAAPYRAGAVWYIHPQIEETLNKMAFPGTGTAVPVYLPAGGLSASPYSTLMGRPVIPLQACAAPSDPGDIVLGDFNAYMSLTKSGQAGIRTDVSMHLYFDTDELAYRFIIRVGGIPWYKSPISAQNGTFDQSGFVTLADRV